MNESLGYLIQPCMRALFALLHILSLPSPLLRLRGVIIAEDTSNKDEFKE